MGLFVFLEVHNTKREEIGGEQGCRADKGEEVPVVTASDAVVEPHAVMVLRLDAGIAYFAVVTTGRAPYAAGTTVFDGHFEMNVVLFGGLDEGPAVRWWDRERVVVGRVGFEGVHITRIYLNVGQNGHPGATDEGSSPLGQRQRPLRMMKST